MIESDLSFEGWAASVRAIASVQPLPDLVLPLPKHTDNYRKVLVRGNLVTAGWIRSYHKTVSQVLMCHPLTIDPPLAMPYRVHMTKAMRSDPHGFEKTIVDALFGQDNDRLVCPQCLPGVFDSKEKKVEVWFVSL